MMASPKIEPPSSPTPSAATSVCRVSEDTGTPSAAEFCGSFSADCTSRKRRRATCFPQPPMQASWKNSRRYSDDRTATTTGAPRNNNNSSLRRPGSARRGTTTPREDQGDYLPSRLQLQRRRPRSAMATGYLGVSSVAFPPPLRRYIESPQHGRRALRSSKSSPSTRSFHSPSKMYRDDVSRDGNGWSEDTGEGGNRDDVTVPLAPRPSGNSPGLLTPVGPGWSETATPVESTECQESVGFPTDSSTDEDDRSVGSEPLTRTEASSSQLEGVHDGDRGDPKFGGDGEPDSRRPPSAKNQGIQQRWRATRGEDQRQLPAARSSRRCRRILRSRAWDLLTGRRIERGRRKGSRDIQVPEVGAFKQVAADKCRIC